MTYENFTDQDYKDLFAVYFKDQYGNPYILLNYQIPIARSILERGGKKKIEINATTRAGKSQTIALAVILYLLDNPGHKVVIIAPTAGQTKIIMDYIAEHITDSLWISEMVDTEVRSNNPERLRKEVSKNKITIKNKSSVSLLSAEGKGERIIGKGGDLVIEDEAELIDDETHQTKIMRMLGDSEDAKIVLIGNSLGNNHFYEASLDPDYEHIHIGWQECVREGRLTQAFIDDRKKHLTPAEFTMWFESKFVEDMESKLIAGEWIKNAIYEPNKTRSPQTEYGLDVAEQGNDWTVLTGVEPGEVYEVISINSWSKTETMPTVGKVINIISLDNKINVDATGIGNGVWSRLKEQNYKSIKLIVGKSPTAEKDRFSNLKAQIFWNLRLMFEEGKIKIPNHFKLIKELNSMKYGFTSNGKIKIIDPKKSPDFVDSLCYAVAKKQEAKVFIPDSGLSF